MWASSSLAADDLYRNLSSSGETRSKVVDVVISLPSNQRGMVEELLKLKLVPLVAAIMGYQIDALWLELVGMLWSILYAM